MARAFVILLHAGWGEDHFDLLLETDPGGPLGTWQCPRNCLSLRPGQALSARRLADHRRAYLTYEGPVSRGRGRVRRAAEGTCETLAESPGRLVVRLDAASGESGVFELTQTGGDVWVITRQESMISAQRPKKPQRRE